MRVNTMAISTLILASVLVAPTLAFEVGGQKVGGVVGQAADAIGGAASDAWKAIVPESSECIGFVGSNQYAFAATVTAIQRNKGVLNDDHQIDSSGSCTQKFGDVAKVIAAEQGIDKGLLSAAWMKCACEKAY